MDFDGEPGFIALTSSDKLTTPRIVIVLYHDGKAYLLMIGATEGIDVDDAVSHIRKSWKWN
jgi:TATA-box binding protein (TBP) (component of TFIID and TFIIIB)